MGARLGGSGISVGATFVGVETAVADGSDVSVGSRAAVLSGVVFSAAVGLWVGSSVGAMVGSCVGGEVDTTDGAGVSVFSGAGVDPEQAIRVARMTSIAVRMSPCIRGLIHMGSGHLRLYSCPQSFSSPGCQLPRPRIGFQDRLHGSLECEPLCRGHAFRCASHHQVDPLFRRIVPHV